MYWRKCPALHRPKICCSISILLLFCFSLPTFSSLAFCFFSFENRYLLHVWNLLVHVCSFILYPVLFLAVLFLLFLPRIKLSLLILLSTNSPLSDIRTHTHTHTFSLSLWITVPKFLKYRHLLLQTEQIICLLDKSYCGLWQGWSAYVYTHIQSTTMPHQHLHLQYQQD